MLRTDSPADDYARYSRDVLEPAEYRADLIDKHGTRLAKILAERPLEAVIANFYAPAGAPIAAEMVAWCLATAADGAQTVAEAMFSLPARNRLIAMYVEAQAADDADEQIRREAKQAEAEAAR